MEFAQNGPTREVVRIRPDGSYWIADDITDQEMRKVFGDLVVFAAILTRQVKGLPGNHICGTWIQPDDVKKDS